MKTWIVTDARGKRHEVTAQKAEIIAEQIVMRNAGNPFSENVAIFCKPVSVTPKGDKPALTFPLAFLRKMWRKYS